MATYDILHAREASLYNCKPGIPLVESYASYITTARARACRMLFKMGERSGLRLQTVFISMQLVDTFLRHSTHMELDNVLLLKISYAAFYIANKYAEVYPADIGSYAAFLPIACILRWEVCLLKAVQWNVSMPTPLDFFCCDIKCLLIKKDAMR